MRALILAAGRGTRISRYLSGQPKCTVNIGDITLIEHTVRQLKEFGINEIGITLGYNAGIVKEILKKYDVEYFYNPFYDVTNSIASAWFAKDFISEADDILVMNGDVFLEDDLLKNVIDEKKSPVFFCDTNRKEEADYKLYFKNNILLKYGKELKGEEISGEYIGIAKIGKEDIGSLIDGINELVKTQNHSLWWENALYRLTDTKSIYVREIKDRFWAEVDYIEDYERILNFRKYSINYNIQVTRLS